MVAVPFSQFDHSFSLHLLDQQKHYSAEQREMTIAHPHLVWVRPQNRALSKRLRAMVWAQGDGACVYCCEKLTRNNFTVDHVWPLAKGGGHEIANLVVACRSCNGAKGAKLPSEWQ